MSSFPFNNPDLDFPLSSPPYNSRIELSEVLGETSKNYVMLGFRPGFPLQASELNEMQEIFYLNSSLYTTMNYYWKDNLPGWLGSFPLYPEAVNPFNNPLGPSTNLIEYTQTGNDVTIYANKGWYNVYSRQSGFRHWIYLNEDLESDLITPDTNDLYVGFDISYEQITATMDSTLYDNSSTNLVSGTPAGANRFKINTNGDDLLLVSAPSPTETTTFSPIVKINSNIVGYSAYLNGYAVPTR